MVKKIGKKKNSDKAVRRAKNRPHGRRTFSTKARLIIFWQWTLSLASAPSRPAPFYSIDYPKNNLRKWRRCDNCWVPRRIPRLLYFQISNLKSASKSLKAKISHTSWSTKSCNQTSLNRASTKGFYIQYLPTIVVEKMDNFQILIKRVLHTLLKGE